MERVTYLACSGHVSFLGIRAETRVKERGRATLGSPDSSSSSSRCPVRARSALLRVHAEATPHIAYLHAGSGLQRSTRVRARP